MRAPVDHRPGELVVAPDIPVTDQDLSAFFQSFADFLLSVSPLLAHGLNGFLADLVIHEETSLHFGGKDTEPEPASQILNAEAGVGVFLGVSDTIRHRNQGLKVETVLPVLFTRTDDLLPEPRHFGCWPGHDQTMCYMIRHVNTPLGKHFADTDCGSSSPDPTFFGSECGKSSRRTPPVLWARWRPKRGFWASDPIRIGKP